MHPDRMWRYMCVSQVNPRPQNRHVCAAATLALSEKLGTQGLFPFLCRAWCDGNLNVLPQSSHWRAIGRAGRKGHGYRKWSVADFSVSEVVSPSKWGRRQNRRSLVRTNQRPTRFCEIFMADIPCHSKTSSWTDPFCKLYGGGRKRDLEKRPAGPTSVPDLGRWGRKRKVMARAKDRRPAPERSQTNIRPSGAMTIAGDPRGSGGLLNKIPRCGDR